MRLFTVAAPPLAPLLPPALGQLGVAVMLELARLFATRQFPGTIIFATVSG